MAQASDPSGELAMSTEERDSDFTTVVSRKEKRKAARTIETDSDTYNESESSIKTLKKKKKKTTKPATSSVASKTAESEDITDSERKQQQTAEATSTSDLQSRSASMFQRILSLIAGAGIEPSRSQKILKAAAGLKEIVNEALLQNRFLEGRIENLREETTVQTANLAKKVEEKLQESIPPKKPLTFAERVGIKAKSSITAAAKEPRNIVTIFPGKNEELKSSDAVKEAVRKLVSPQTEGIGIRNVRKIQNNGILIETDTRGDIETLLKNKKIKDSGMEIGLPAKKQPKIIVFGVPRAMSEEGKLAGILEHNFKDSKSDLEKVSTGCKVAFKTGDKSKDKCNLVLEVSKEAREVFNKRERLYVGWDCCRFQDYVVPTRCFKCQSYGHITKHCKAEKESCGHCGAVGHSHKECPNKEKPAVCINCKRAGKPCNHSVKDKECFAFRAATQVVISRTDYGL